MWLDNNLLLDDGVLVDATQISTYSVNMGAARKIGAGKQMYVIIIVDTVFATSDSVNFQVVTDTVATLASPTVQIETGAIAIASLTAGRTPIVIPIGSAIGTEEQYLGLQYTVAGSTGTGNVTAFIAFDYQSNWGD